MHEADSYAPTTERLDVDSYLASAGSYLIYLFHISTYEFAAQRLGPSARVLDYGCGTGYGSHHLAESGLTVVGVDVSDSAVRHAAGRYEAPGLTFQAIPPVETAPLPFEDDSFDAVVSFQVIEHVPSVDAYLAEVARVLRPGGTLLCATPDRVTRLFRHQRPWNRWHLEEFSQDGLAKLIARHLRVQEVLGMTAPSSVVELELRRCRLLRFASLPFTFPGSPERWRVFGLEAMRAASDLVRRVRRVVATRRTPATTSAVQPPSYPFGPDEIVIAAGATPSTNTVVVATKPAQSTAS